MSIITGAVGAKLGGMAAGTFGWTAATWSQIGWTAGVLVGTYLFAPDGPDVVSEGSRLGDLKVTSSTYGVDIPKVFGAYRISGNIIWALPLQETRHEERQEEGKGGGGGSSTTIWYTYAATFAIALCEGPIGGVRKIWFGNVLVYDDGEFGKGIVSSNVTFYNGTDLQNIDWRIQSDKSDTPAYRNIAYVVFNNVQLEDHGNVIPNVTCEVIKNGDSINIRHVHAEAMDTTCDVRYSWCMNPAPTTIAKINNSGNTYRKLLEPDIITYSNESMYDVWRNSYSISYDGNTQALNYRKYYSGLGYSAFYDGENYWAGKLTTGIINSASGTRIFRMNGKVYTMHADSSGKFNYLLEQVFISGEAPYPDEPTAIVILNRPLNHITQYDDGYITLGHDDSITLFDDDFNEVKTFNFVPAIPFIYNIAGNGMAQLIGVNGNKLYTASGVGSGWSFEVINIEEETINYIGSVSGGSTIWNVSSYNNFSVNENYIYNANIQSLNAGPSWNIFILGGITDNGIILSDIVEELLLDCGLEQGDFDVSAGLLTKVDGYVVSKNMTSRSAIEPLLSAYEFTLVELDHKIVLRKQNQISIANVLEDDLGVNTNNSLERNIKQELDLIKSLSVMYSNANSDYQISIQQVRRIDVKAENEIIIELPLVLTDNQAKQLAEKMLYRNWEMRKSFSFSLPFSYKDLIPGDVITILLSDSSIEVRLTKITITENNKLLCDAIANNQDFYDSFAIGSDTGINGSEVLAPVGPTEFKILDIPTIHNDYLSAEGMYVAATGYTNTWSGCTIYSKPIEIDDFKQELMLFGKMPIGFSLNVLPDHSSSIWDLTSSITVFSSEPLYEITTESVLNGNNYALIGSEVIQFSKVTDLGNNLYTLEWLLRGRRGTEHETLNHVDNEDFIFLKSTTMGFIPKTLYSNHYYNALTIGNSIDKLEETIQKQYLGINLKPFSVSCLNAINDISDNVTVTWVRRSRYISGHFDRLELVDTPELYNIDVIDNYTDELLNTYQSSTPSFSYTSTMKESDGILGVTKFIVSQISGVYGKGEEVETTASSNIYIIPNDNTNIFLGNSSSWTYGVNGYTSNIVGTTGTWTKDVITAYNDGDSHVVKLDPELYENKTIKNIKFKINDYYNVPSGGLHKHAVWAVLKSGSKYRIVGTTDAYSAEAQGQDFYLDGTYMGTSTTNYIEYEVDIDLDPDIDYILIRSSGYTSSYSITDHGFKDMIITT